MTPPRAKFAVRCRTCGRKFAHKAALRMHRVWKHPKTETRP